jgi:dynamin-binding protein
MRPSTGRSYDSPSLPRQSSESTTMLHRRDSNSTFNSSYPGGPSATSASSEQQRRLSGLFNSALPMPEGPDESARSSRASSRDRGGNSGYNVLWLAASLFEFNIETTKHEAGYPYLTYQAGEVSDPFSLRIYLCVWWDICWRTGCEWQIFDVIAEKGELWLAKNQDDPRDVVGWIWSKHFAKLADS